MSEYDIPVSVSTTQCPAVEEKTFADTKIFYKKLLTDKEHKQLNGSLKCLIENEKLVGELKDRIKSYLIYLIKTNPQDTYAQKNKDRLLDTVEKTKRFLANLLMKVFDSNLS